MVSPFRAEAVASGEFEQVVTHRPLVGALAGLVAFAGAFERHAAGVVADLADFLDFRGSEADVGQCGEFADLVLDGAGGFAGLLDEGGHDALHGGMAEVPDGGELEQGEVVFFREREHAVRFFHAVLDPALGPVSPVVAGFELVAGKREIAVKHSAVVHDAGHHLDAVFLAGGKREADGPRLQRIENEHRPIDQIAEVFQTVEQVERETVRRSGSDAEHAGEAFVFRGSSIACQRGSLV